MFLLHLIDGPAGKPRARRLSILLALFVSVALLPAGIARAADRQPQASTALPTVAVRSNTVVPPGFSTDANQAIAAAKTSPVLQALHRREHPLTVVPYWWNMAPSHWFIEFQYRGQIVGTANVTGDGRLTGAWTGPLAVALYARGHYAPIFDSPWVVVTFSILFLLPFLDPRRLRRLIHLDALMLLSFMVSYCLFDHAHLEAAVWLAYPPLIYLLFRMLRLGFLRTRSRQRLAPLLSARVLTIGLLVLVGARVALSLFAPNVIDVGFASVIGGDRVLHGLSPYYTAAGHGDTYGPIVYLAYAPFELLFPWHGQWDYLGSARAASIVFDLVTVGGLVWLGRRLRAGRDGLRLGLVLGWAWAACPFTLLALMMHTNDGLIAMLSVLSLLAFASPAGRGALLALAAAAKFSPAALLPLYAGSRQRGLRAKLICIASFAFVVVLAVGLYLPSGGLKEFYDQTIGFQLNRADVFSIWGLHPALDPIKVALGIGAVLLAIAVAFFPRRPATRSIVQVSALAAAVTIAVQLPAVHWFYYYIIWFLPFVFVALLATPAEPRSREPELGLERDPLPVDDHESEPVLVGA